MEHRHIQFDFLRIVAAFHVMMIHVSVSSWEGFDVGSSTWNVFNFYDSISRFSVPVFIMISGAIFLDPSKKITIAQLYRKYIIRLVEVFFFWAFAYAAAIFVLGKGNIGLHGFWKYLINGRSHMWYLLMLIGLYMCIPVLRRVVEDKQCTKYFLVVWLIMDVIYPTVYYLLPIEEVNYLYGMLWGTLSIGYAGVFVLGYYLNTLSELTKKKEAGLYLLGILGIVITFVLTKAKSDMMGGLDVHFYEYLSLNVVATAAAVFVCAKRITANLALHQRTLRIVRFISECTMGMYLVHDFFNLLFAKIGFTTLMFAPIIMVPVMTICVFCGSFLLTIICRRIPIIRRFL